MDLCVINKEYEKIFSGGKNVVENISLKDDEIALRLKDSETKLNIAQLALQTAGFEISYDSEKLEIFLEDLTVAETEVNTEVQNLNTIHKDILIKLKEKNDAIKLADVELENFKKEKHTEFEQVKADFEKRVKMSQNDADNKYKLEEKQAKSTITSKEREKNSKLSDATRLKDSEIKAATKTYENQLKQISTELTKTLSLIELTKKNKILQAEKSLKDAQKNTANLVSLSDKASTELIKLKTSLQNTPEGPKRAQLLEKQKSISDDYSKMSGKIEELRQEEVKQKQAYDAVLVSAEEEAKSAQNEKNEWAEEERAKAEALLKSVTDEQNSKVEQLQEAENDNFTKIKVERSTSVSDLRNEQLKMLKQLNIEKDNTVGQKEKEMLQNIENKENETKEKKMKLIEDYENYRKSQLLVVYPALSSKVAKLAYLIEQVKEYEKPEKLPKGTTTVAAPQKPAKQSVREKVNA